MPAFVILTVVSNLSLFIAVTFAAPKNALAILIWPPLIVSIVAAALMYRLEPYRTETYISRMGIGLTVSGILLWAFKYNEITAFVCGFGGLFVYGWGWKLRYRRQNYDWYLQTYPDTVRGGRVHCCWCGSPRIRTERLMQRQYMRRHYCAQCGGTLYHTPE